ncbi:Succinate-semialdehyde dehydrogenase [NADP(+)] GabD [Aspergillus cristatus]|uniref:Succinate-semialdehyde dehydrogenase n=1 Tax=Aspergillus cristatus TaxID=573508 RepID=A0A1E3BEM2_ASPCR|nr:Succinate-semialdehyde dehydrogenase [NADP(+)] GabD [Aspergillus cristatus]
MVHTVPPLNDPSLFIQKAYVNGDWVDARSGKTFDVFDPASESLIGTCPEFDTSDAESAIQAATDAFPAFCKTSGRERAHILRRWHQLMMDNTDDLATLLTWENGKPLADAKGEIKYAASFLEWFSEEAPRIYGDVIPASVRGNRIFTLKQPVGVCGLITPWNFPAAMITRKIGPALAAGCTVVAKTPAETPFTANAIAELARRAGIPRGVVNIITALDNTVAVGELLTTHPSVRKVSFTGSTNVGKLLMKQSASTLKKVSWELGGNAPFIVFDDVGNLDAAISGAVASKFRNSGQTCVSANRIYIQRGVYDDFVKRFVAQIQGFKIGGGFDNGITHGPVIHDKAVAKAHQHVQDAISKGARVAHGGRRLTQLGHNFYDLTVLTEMTKDMIIASEETFGPVAGLFPFESEEEVINLANHAEVGLAGYIFSRDIKRIFRVAEALEVGMVGVNTGSISDAASPFGGIKQSGFGREGSKYGIDEFMVVKSVTLGGIDEPLQT